MAIFHQMRQTLHQLVKPRSLIDGKWVWGKPVPELFSLELIESIDEVYKEILQEVLAEDGLWSPASKEAYSRYFREVTKIFAVSFGKGETISSKATYLGQAASSLYLNACDIFPDDMGAMSDEHPLPLLTPTFVEDYVALWSRQNDAIQEVCYLFYFPDCFSDFLYQIVPLYDSFWGSKAAGGIKGPKKYLDASTHMLRRLVRCLDNPEEIQFTTNQVSPGLMFCHSDLFLTASPRR